VSIISINEVKFQFERNEVISAEVEYSYEICADHIGEGNIFLDKDMLEKYGYDNLINKMVSVTTDYSKGLVSLIEKAFKGEMM